VAANYSAALDAFSQKLDALNGARHTLDKQGDPVVTVKSLQQQLAPIESRADRAWTALKIPACANQ